MVFSSVGGDENRLKLDVELWLHNSKYTETGTSRVVQWLSSSMRSTQGTGFHPLLGNWIHIAATERWHIAAKIDSVCCSEDSAQPNKYIK